MKKIVLVVLLLTGGFSVSAQTTNEDEYTKTLYTYFQKSGSEASFSQVVSQLVGMMKDKYPEIDKSFWKEFEKEMKNSSMIDIAVKLTPIYKKYLTLDDLKQIIAFYESPVGKKLSDNTPAISSESISIGQEWGRELAQKIVSKLEAKKKK